MSTVLIGPPMQPPHPPLLTGNDREDIEAIIVWANDLISYLYQYQPAVVGP